MENANLHAVLANVTTRELWVAHAAQGQNASLQPFVHFDLKRLFLRPEDRLAASDAAVTPGPDDAPEPALEGEATAADVPEDAAPEEKTP